MLDPRYGLVTVEVVTYDKVAHNIERESVGLTPCTESSPELDISSESVKQSMLSQNLFCFKDIDKIELYGELS